MSGKILSTGRVLVLDDEEIMRESLSGWLLEDGLEVVTAENGAEALQVMANQAFDLMLVDLRMPEMDGIRFLQKVHDIQPQTPALIMTAYASVATATQAMKEGAYDYITKPFNPEDISKTIREVLRTERLLRENILLRLNLEELYDFHNIVGKNSKMQEIVPGFIGKAADSRSNVFIQGESGTGKDLIAKAIHYNSRRSSRPFIAVPCAWLPQSLFERALFGFGDESGSDAESSKCGMMEQAEGGTLLLDEIGALGPGSQEKLLLVLQEREFMRIGGKRHIHANVRVISTSSRDLLKGIQDGWFSEDLYRRINVFSINLAPLRERKEDIPLLVEHFINKYNALNARSLKGVGDEALSLLMNYEWPGNVRELENAVELAMLVNGTGIISREDLPPHITAGANDYAHFADSLSLDAAEHEHIAMALQKNNWNIKKTADALKIDRSTLYAKIDKFKLCPKNSDVSNCH